MTLYSHIQIFCNSGFLTLAQSKQKILFYLTENTASVNPTGYGTDLLIGSSSHKKRRSSSAITAVLFWGFFLNYKFTQTLYLHAFSILSWKKL